MNCKLRVVSSGQIKVSLAGASEGILVRYGKPSEVQFTRVGVVAESKIWEI